jgi:hypothetical protein
MVMLLASRVACHICSKVAFALIEISGDGGGGLERTVAIKDIKTCSGSRRDKASILNKISSLTRNPIRK